MHLDWLLLFFVFVKQDEASIKNHETSNGDTKKKRKDRSRSRSKEKRRRSRSRSKGRKKRSRSKSRDKKRSKDKKRSRSRDRRSRSKDRRRSKSPRRRSRERRRSRSYERRRERKRSKSRSPSFDRRRERRRSRSRSPYYPRDFHKRSRFSRSPGRRSPLEDLTPEERDARTVFCMQLSARVRARDIEEFFSSVGKVTDVRLITDNKTRRSKGICYVEFKEVSSVTLALGLTGQKLLGVPIMVQPSQAEKNRAAASANNMQKVNTGPMRLYVGSLHFNITEDMLKGIFEPFGKIDTIQLMMDTETGRSKGFGFIMFHNSEDAKKALEQLNGFELAGRPMKVNHVTERADFMPGPSFLDSEEMDKAGIDLGTTGRLHLMAKLAEGTGMELPPAAQTALSYNQDGAPVAPTTNQAVSTPPIATQCFMLSNMFDLSGDLSATWDQEIKDDVIEECRKHGGIVHIYVDTASPQGNVYVKCPTINAAAASVNSLHGRFFAGKVITAAYVPVINYHNLFADALNAHSLL